ncbi:hypothetical protein Cgig2_026572 [Carnegiea gigantea]|uniref:RING-type E3 ubiquitin transferase n=1 Tax=Carnegiea gigantea TaxID=171969 RepID=A0A9Q1JYG8_9CARY|nr:hypothetical protein Cgig2_026572 [Carnegiea gigantea]
MFSRKLLVNLHHSGGLLLHTPLNHEPQPIAQPPTPSHYQDSSFRGGFDANLIMILSCSSLLAREPNYYISTIRPGVSRVDGVDRRALRSFPIVKYSKEVNVQGLDTDCVICLSEFKEGEKLRILPKCNHGFHVKCIDKWLKSHSSCPTCRQSLVDTCQKIIGCHDDHQDASSPSPSSLPERVIGEVIALNIVPLEREDLVRNYRGQIVT